MEHRPIFIVGMPASGKSTFGRALSRALGRRYIDLDHYIENRFRTTVRELFATVGEEAFRDLEGAMLREVGEFEDVVVATGGGAPCHLGNMEYMLSRGETVWLRTPVGRLMQRIRLRPDKRPLLAGLDGDALRTRLGEMHAARVPFYSRAHLRIDSSRLEDRAQIAESVAAFLPLLQSK